MVEVSPKHISWYAKFFLNQRDPAVTAFPYACNNLSDDPSNKWSKLLVVSIAPVSQRMSHFDGSEHFPTEDVVKNLRDSIGTEYCVGGIETGDELFASDGFRGRIRRKDAIQEAIQPRLKLGPKLFEEMFFEIVDLFRVEET